MAGRAKTWTARDRDLARARIGEIVAGLPDVAIDELNGHAGYSVGKKRFAWLLVDHHGDGRLALCVKAPPGEQQELVAADPTRYFVPAYLGKSGWIGIAIDPASDPDWAGVAELLRQGWRASAGKRAVAALDAQPRRARR